MKNNKTKSKKEKKNKSNKQILKMKNCGWKWNNPLKYKIIYNTWLNKNE